MSTEPRLRFTLLGTGSSGGVPRVGNDWGACDPGEPKNRRRRCSALVDVFDAATPTERTRILIDTAPDLREQLLDAQVAHLDAILFTHDHADQTHGIDDVRPLAIRHRRQIAAYMDAPTRQSLLPKFRYCFEGHGDYPPILDLQPDIQVRLSYPGRGAVCRFWRWIRNMGVFARWPIALARWPIAMMSAACRSRLCKLWAGWMCWCLMPCAMPRIRAMRTLNSHWSGLKQSARGF